MTTASHAVGLGFDSRRLYFACLDILAINAHTILVSLLLISILIYSKGNRRGTLQRKMLK